MTTPIDPVDLTKRLIRCRSVTPADDGAIGLLGGLLSEAGFDCHRADRGGIANLIARFGPKGHTRTFGYNGHTDVVPEGDASEWSVDPFAAEIRDGMVWGRGAADMKSSVAAMVSAAVDMAAEAPDGAILLTITGDEEGDAFDGTRALLDAMADRGEAMDICLVGEPTSAETLGDTAKIGRRGSLNAFFTAKGVQGHTAYPHRARNAAAAMARLMSLLSTHLLDTGTEHFDASTIAVTTIDTGNKASNVVPASCSATVNIRFNDAHTGAGLSDWLRATMEAIAEDTGVEMDLRVHISGESFLTPPGRLSDLVANAVEAETGLRPDLSTTGGTSDARFVKDHCPVMEFGLVGKTIHQTDERVPVDEIRKLKDIYLRILRDYFA